MCRPPLGLVVGRLGPVLVAAMLVGASLSACSRDASPRAAAAVAASASAASPSTHDHAVTAGGSGQAGSAPAATGDAGPVAGPRLQALLAQHAVLAADMMRARLRRDPDFAQAAQAAVTRNTQALSTLVGSLFGADAATTFAPAWSGHVAELFAYAEARRAGNTDDLQRARERLVQAERQLGAFFAGASRGRLTPEAAAEGVRMHVDHLLGQADAYAAGDYAAAAVAYREGYEHAFELGGALARALLPAKDVAALSTPAWQLRANMTQLLGQHVALVVASLRAASGEGRDFTALGAELNRNTQGLSTAVGTLFGPAAATRFQSLWGDHVDGLMAVTVGTTRGDTAGRQEGERRLRAFEPALAAFFDTATRSRLGAAALAHAFAQHDRMLVDGVEAYQAKDYSKAHDLGNQAYDEMFEVAGQLSNAIRLTLASKLPKGGSQTGGGGTAAARGGR